MRPRRALDYVRALWTVPIRHPSLVLCLALASLVPAVRASLSLPVRTSLTELVPESKPSVIELRRVNQRLAGVSTLIVVAEGRDADSLTRFVDELASRIRGLGREYVIGVDEGNREARSFLRSHKFLYADLADLEALRDEIVARYDYEVGKRTGLDLGLSDEAPPAPITRDEVRARLGKLAVQSPQDPPAGYYLAENGHLASILVRTPFESADPRAFELETKIRQLGAEVAPERWDPSLRIFFTGNLVTSAEEHRAVTTDLAHVGTAGVALILAVVFVFFLRARVLLVMLVTIAVACFWSFAVAFLAVGYLNSATGFLVSIIAGNGINFGIVLTARYLESRLRDRRPARQAVTEAMRMSAPGTLTAAVCATVAYGSLAVTDFRGFRHFGIIGGAGMLLSWIASYTVLPALLVIGERLVPIREVESSWANRYRASFARPFLYLAQKFRTGVLVVAGVASTLFAGLSVRYVLHDPLEYNLTNVRNEAHGRTSARVLARRIEGSVERLNRDGRALLADRIDQVQPLVAELRRRKDAAPRGQEPFDRVVSVFDLLPADQDAKLPVLAEIVDRIRRARKLHAIPDADWAELEPELPTDLRAIGIDDLPNDIAWPFEEADGSRGRVVYLIPASGRSMNDAHYLMQWADSFREVRLPNGEVIRGSGDPVILADMLDQVRVDAPKAMALSVACTLLVVIAAFRARRAGWLSLGSVFFGITWLVAILAIAKIHINFLNFVALPVSVGVGADYAVNIMKRYEIERGSDLARSVLETGGAVVLCSLTTLLGYAALTISINGAVRSFGTVGALGEMTMLLSAMLVLPAILLAQRSSSLGLIPRLGRGLKIRTHDAPVNSRTARSRTNRPANRRLRFRLRRSSGSPTGQS